MAEQVNIRMMGYFAIEANGTVHEELMAKSRKGVSLIQYLVLEQGRPVSSQRLIRELWSGSRNGNPENALKTMVSRMRSSLNEISPGLGMCIVSGQGGYRWCCAENVLIDVLKIIDLLKELRTELAAEERIVRTEHLLELYRGDLYLTGDLFSGQTMCNWLHNEYLNAVYRMVDALKEREEYNRICEVCRKATKVDDLDEQLHIELMQAMVNLNRVSDAAAEYLALRKNSRQILDAEPGQNVQEAYETLADAGKTIKFNLDVIRNELLEREDEWKGPFFCDYPVFKEIYNIQMRNLERLGSTMFLAVIMLGNLENSSMTGKTQSCMAGLQEILRMNMRKGDIITRFSENTFAMLLPMVNYSTGSLVMERIEHLYYQEYAALAIPFHVRISPLGQTPLVKVKG